MQARLDALLRENAKLRREIRRLKREEKRKDERGPHLKIKVTIPLVLIPVTHDTLKIPQSRITKKISVYSNDTIRAVIVKIWNRFGLKRVKVWGHLGYLNRECKTANNIVFLDTRYSGVGVDWDKIEFVKVSQSSNFPHFVNALCRETNLDFEVKVCEVPDLLDGGLDLWVPHGTVIGESLMQP